MTTITFSGDATSKLADNIKSSFDRAIAADHKLPNNVLRMQGMSGIKYRMLINNLIASIGDARYLEVGSWSGSTACSAIYGNAVTATCIDNWSEFGGPKNEFHNNINAVLGSDIDFKFIENDFRQVDFTNIGKFNIYLFDGPHETIDQYDGIAMAMPALDDQFILIIDDWNGSGPRDGTMNAVSNLGLTVLYSITIRTTDDGSHAAPAFENSDWHNGYFIALVSKI
jgi:hypothetical protein